MQYKQRIKDRIKIIKDIMHNKKYLLIFLIIAIAYFAFSLYLINYFFVGIKYFFSYDETWYIIANLTLTFIVSILLGINITLNIHRFAEIRKLSKTSTISIFGSFFSFLGIGCPSCSLSIISSLLPSIGSFIVIGALPLKGLEIQILSIVILLFSLYFITKENTCKI